MKEYAKRLLPVLIIILAMAAFLIPQKLQERAANAFGAPLFEHVLPADSTLIQQDAAKDDEGGTTAALLLQTELTSQELENFYSDINYPPAEEGQTVTLRAKALDDSSLAALKQAKLYTDGASYQFVYLYSK